MYCATCNKLITSESTSLLGHNYHSECLFCTRCKTKLWYKPFIKKKDGKLFCENLCSDEPLVLPPINGNANSLAALRKSYSLKRKQSALDNLNLSLDETTNYNSQMNNNIFGTTSNNDRFLSNAEILRRRELLKNDNSINKIEANAYDATANQGKQIRKNRNKVEPFDYNRVSDEITNGVTTSTVKNTKMSDEPFSYNFEKKNLNKDHDQQRLANTSPFALYSKPQADNNTNNSSTNATTSNANNDTVSFCDKCSQFIEDNKEKYTFNGQTFHKKCFRCNKCFTELFRMKKVLTGSNGTEYYCEPCYSKEFGPKCPKCNEPIASYMLTTSFENKLYHKECFVCQRCKKYITNEQYFKTGKMILCRNCL